MTTLAQLSAQLLRSGYDRSADGTFIASDRRRIVVLMEADADPSRWPGQVTAALAAAGVQQMPAWARYVVLVHSAEPDEGLRATAASFSRDVTKCRRLLVFHSGDASVPALPFLPLDTRSATTAFAPELDVTKIIEKHLESDLASLFADPETTHAAVERDIERRASE